MPDGKWSTGLLGKGTENSSYGEIRGGVRWVSGNNQVRQKTKNSMAERLEGEKRKKEKVGNRMSLVLGQSHSGDL